MQNDYFHFFFMPRTMWIEREIGPKTQIEILALFRVFACFWQNKKSIKSSKNTNFWHKLIKKTILWWWIDFYKFWWFIEQLKKVKFIDKFMSIFHFLVINENRFFGYDEWFFGYDEWFFWLWMFEIYVLWWWINTKIDCIKLMCKEVRVNLGVKRGVFGGFFLGCWPETRFFAYGHIFSGAGHINFGENSGPHFSCFWKKCYW